MADIFSKKKRSEIMSKIRSKNTKIELLFKRALRKAKIPFKFQPKIYGHPDFLVGKNIAVFCDSAFWHGRDWKILRKKLSRAKNSLFWINHIKKNRYRDRRVTRFLGKTGFVVLRFWEDESSRDIESCILLIAREFEKSSKKKS